ncbi:MAG: 50S ribosomal protein L25 [Patescibacteria group bacterium]
MELKVQTRNIFGKKVKTLREEGLVPAELYGHGVNNQHLTLSAKEFQKIFKEAGESAIVNLITEDKKTLPVMIHEVKTDSLSGEILNIDFYQIKLTEKIRVYVPIEFIGEAPAVKNYGGILIKTLKEIEIEALPQDLPRHLQANLESLAEIGKNIAVKDLEISDKIKLFVNPETIIATVVEAKAEEEIAAETATAEAASEEIPATSSENKIPAPKEKSAK